MAAIDVAHVSKTFDRGRPVLKDVSFSLNKGEMVGLIGASGSGKSTLIRAIAGLVPIDECKTTGNGHIHIFGQSMQKGGRIARDAKALRARVGVVFQQFNLVPRLSVLSNVCLGLLGQVPVLRATLGRFTHEERRRAMAALARVGIAEHALKRGTALSGGQQQRAAIARTLVQGADVLIADEPIASLDPTAARRVMDILAELNARDGITVIVSLHQVDYALAYCRRIIALKDGRVAYDGASAGLTQEFLHVLYGAESSDVLLGTRTKSNGHGSPAELTPLPSFPARWPEAIAARA